MKMLKIDSEHYAFPEGIKTVEEFIEFVNELYIVFNPIMNTIFNLSQVIYNFITNAINYSKDCKNWNKPKGSI